MMEGEKLLEAKIAEQAEEITTLRKMLREKDRQIMEVKRSMREETQGLEAKVNARTADLHRVLEQWEADVRMCSDCGYRCENAEFCFLRCEP